MKFKSATKITGLVLVALFILTRLYDLPRDISLILSFCWFLYVPYSLGFSSLEISRRYSKKLDSSRELLGSTVILLDWFTGLLIILAISYPLLIANIPIMNFIGPLLLLISVGAIWLFKPSKSIPFSKKFNLRILLILIMGVSFGLYVRSFSPFPLSPGIDVFNHMYVIQNILDNSYRDILIYFPAFDIVVALGSSTFNVDLNAIFWLGSVFISMIFSLSCYTMLYYFLKNNAQAILGTAIALPLTEMGFASNLQYFYPSSFLICIFPLMFFLVDFIWKRLKSYSKIVTIMYTIMIFSVLILLHTYIGLIMLFALSVYILCYYYLAGKERMFLILRLVTVALSLALLAYCLGIITFQFQMEFIEGKIFKTYDLYATDTKVMHLEQWYTVQILLASAIGFVLLSFYKAKRVVILNFVGVVMFLVYFQQISDIHRIMPLERAFIAMGTVTTFTLPIIILIQKFKNGHLFNGGMKKISVKSLDASQPKVRIAETTSERFKKTRLIKYLGTFQTYREDSKILSIYVIIIFAFLFPILLVPFDIYTEPYTSRGYDLTNYTFEELKASKWIKENIPENYKIFSDPSTVIEFRGLSNRPHIEGIGWNLTVAQEVRSVLFSENASDAYEKIMTSHGNNTVIVITPRTSEWLNGNSYFTQLPIEEFNYFEGIEKFFDKNYFRSEYSKDSIFIFTLL